MLRRLAPLTVLIAAATFVAPSRVRADDTGGPDAPPSVVDPCRPAIAQDFTTDDQEIRGRKIPDRDYYRDEAMNRASLELEDARKVVKDWDAIEGSYRAECYARQARRSALEQLAADLAELQDTADCAAFRQKLDGIAAALIHENHDPIIYDVGVWLESRRLDAKDANFCAERFPQLRNDLRAWAAPITAQIARLLSQRGAEIDMAARYRSQARKRFTVDALAAYHLALRAAQEKDAGDQLAEKTVGKLPWIIVILGVFCLSIMVMVRRFEHAVQLEWVRSGQVIQFMTVTIMIIVILSLGLSENLNKESLGTLLGTIGGYVLSNGLTERKAGQAAPKKDDEPPPSPPSDPKDTDPKKDAPLQSPSDPKDTKSKNANPLPPPGSNDVESKKGDEQAQATEAQTRGAAPPVADSNTGHKST